ncbi:MAG: DNA-binding domain-containing protein [Bacteroidetes bacterium]|nr:DNA-binding domain-containing protein [Bacteroidota bacterium]
MPLKKFTQQQQSDLAGYCRTNELHEDLQVRRERVHHYRRLVFNVVNDSLQSAFPLTKNLLEDKIWDQLVHQFFSAYKPQSPQVWKMPGEFYEWFSESEQPLRGEFPFIDELLQFEWMEVVLFMMEDIPYPESQKEGNWMDSTIATNPEFRIIQTNYPVHLRKAATIQDADKGDYFILMFREKDTGRIQFMDLSPFFAVVVDNIAHGADLRSVLLALQEQMPQTSLLELQENTIPLLEKLKDKGFITGFKE